MIQSEELLKMKVWAVVGAGTDRDKYGYKIYKRLKKHGYIVYPVNPGYTEIEGDPCYKSIKDLPQKPEVINMVVNPRIGVNVIEEAREIGVKYLWFQPGTFNSATEQACDTDTFEYVKDCVLVALAK